MKLFTKKTLLFPKRHYLQSKKDCHSHVLLHKYVNEVLKARFLT